MSAGLAPFLTIGYLYRMPVSPGEMSLHASLLDDLAQYFRSRCR